MASINLIEAFQDFKEAENIDRPTLMKVVEDVFKTLLRKKFGSDENFDVIVNAEKGDLEIMRRRMIVEDGAVQDPLAEVPYSEAVKIEPDFEVGEEVSEQIDIEEFGRRAVTTARQTLMQKVKDLEKRQESEVEGLGAVVARGPGRRLARAVPRRGGRDAAAGRGGAGTSVRAGRHGPGPVAAAAGRARRLRRGAGSRCRCPVM